MKKSLYIIVLATVALLATSCSSSNLTKGEQYAKLYEEKPVTLLVMPPINKTTNVDAKDLLFTSVSKPLIEAGYYVIPPMMAMEALRNESAYDAEMFFDAPLGKFKEYFGADAVIFPVIDKWNKMLNAIYITLTYTVKSTTSNEILFERTCELKLDFSNTNNSSNSFLVQLIDLAVSTAEAALTDHIEAARKANGVIFEDIPAGKYHPRYLMDMEDEAKPKLVKTTIKG